MTTTDKYSDRTMKIILLVLVLFAICFAELLHAQTPKTYPTKFSAKTLTIGVENFLRDRLEETDEFEIAGDIEEQVFDDQYVVARCEASPESLAGNTKVALVFSKNDRVLRRAYVSVRVTLKRKVPVFTRSMQRGEVIQQNDIEIKLTDVTYVKDKPLQECVGMRLTQNVNRGSVVQRQYVSESSSIMRGDAVQIVMQSNGVVIRANGQSLDDAKSGQSVRVKRDDSSTILTGVAGEGKVVNVSLQTPSTSQK